MRYSTTRTNKKIAIEKKNYQSVNRDVEETSEIRDDLFNFHYDNGTYVDDDFGELNQNFVSFDSARRIFERSMNNNDERRFLINSWLPSYNHQLREERSSNYRKSYLLKSVVSTIAGASAIALDLDNETLDNILDIAGTIAIGAPILGYLVERNDSRNVRDLFKDLTGV